MRMIFKEISKPKLEENHEQGIGISPVYLKKAIYLYLRNEC